MAEKPSWDEVFILQALILSSRGSCDRLRTACVLVKNNRIVGAGYNGAVAGTANCDDVGHLMIDGHCERTLHGEENAIHNAVGDLRDTTAYIIATPCLDCVKSLLQRDVRRIVYVGSYANAKGQDHMMELCLQKQVRLEQWSGNPVDVLKILQKALVRLSDAGGLFYGLTPSSH